MPRSFGQYFGGVRDPGGLVALAAERNRGEVGRVGFHQQPVERDVAGDLAQFG